MSNIQFHFDDNFQLGIFELMMNDTSFCEKAVLFLKADYFKNQFYAWFFETNKKLMEEYKSAPTHLQIRNEIMRFAPEKREKYLLIYQKITKPTSQRDYKYIRDNLEEFVKKAMRFQLNELLVKTQNQGSDYVDKLLSDQIQDYNNISFGNTQCQNLRQLTTIMEQAALDQVDLIPTYMPTMDRALGGGVPRGTLTLGLSGTNVGKSIWLINWTYHLIMNGFKVFYINLEGYERQTILRLTSRAIGVPFGTVKWNKLSDIEMQKRNAFIDKCKDNIQILHDSSFGFPIEDIIAIAKQKKEEFDYDMLIVDYGQIAGAKKKYSELRHEQAYIHRGLSSVAGELNIGTATVAQGNRETQEKNNQGKGLIRMGDISECFEIVRACSTVFTLNRSAQDIEMDTARVLLDKSRDGRTNVIEVMKTNFDRTAFYGSTDEGLGFMAMEDYIHASTQQK